MSKDPDMEIERAAFEHWYLTTQCANNKRRVHRDECTGVYSDRVVAIAWRAWRQALKRAVVKSITQGQAS